MMKEILSAADANGDSLIVDHNGGEVEVVVEGTFDGATVTAYLKMDGRDTWVPASENSAVAAWTEPMVKAFKTLRKCQIKLTISSAGASTEITAAI